MKTPAADQHQRSTITKVIWLLKTVAFLPKTEKDFEFLNLNETEFNKYFEFHIKLYLIWMIYISVSFPAMAELIADEEGYREMVTSIFKEFNPANLNFDNFESSWEK